MTSKIDFENFKNGDKVIITISGRNGEEIFPCKIIKISPIKKLIHFEDNESEYECNFSEVKSIVRTKPPFPYGVLIILYFILTILSVDFPLPILEYFPHDEVFGTVPLILILLDIWQYFRIKKDKLNVYEKQNNTPYVLSVPTCAYMYPGLLSQMLYLLDLHQGFDSFDSLAGLVIFLILTAWFPGLIWFVKDQKRLYQYSKNHQCNKNFVVRIIEFLVCYPFFTFVGYGLVMVYLSR